MTLWPLEQTEKVGDCPNPQAQNGLEYVSKCINGGDAYETSKFAEGLSHLTLSDGLWRTGPP